MTYWSIWARRSGLWMLGSQGQSWSPAHGTKPNAFAAGDIDGNYQDDLVVAFPSEGVWAWMNHTSWMRITTMTATRVALADLNDDRRKEVVLGVPGSGLWLYEPTGFQQWRQLSPAAPTLMAVCPDMGGERGGDNLAVSFPGAGVWVASSLTWWQQIHTRDASVLACAKGEPRPDQFEGPMSQVLVGFTGAGLWSYRAVFGPLPPYGIPGLSSVWQQVHPWMYVTSLLAISIARAPTIS